MKNIKIEVHWCEKNFACAYDYPKFGCVIVTHKTLDGLKTAFLESLKWHIESAIEDGEFVPEFFRTGEYEVEFELATSALLRTAEQFTTMAALSRVTGINQRLLSNYASEVKKPRPAQREKIISGIHEIGRSMLGLC